MSRRQRTVLTWALTAAGMLFLVLGVLRGEDTVVWRKAVNVCMECIGLG